MSCRKICIVLAGLLALAATPASGYNPSLNWYTISTEHFDVHYHEGAEWTAREVARIAEEVHPFITEVYDYDPGRCHFVVIDDQDYANGAAYYYDNKIEIWATNLEFGLRGTTQWLRNVVTHEYTHIVSIQAAMKLPLRIPALYFQVIGFEDEKRPDVLTGYPNLIASYPLAGAVVPPWWAEGVAQYQSPERRYDCWDTHREMILRAGVTQGKMLSYDEMGFFGHGSLGNEQVYDHGYGLVRFIAAQHGPESIRRTSEELGDLHRLTIDGALKKATGKDGRTLYDEWVAWMTERYERQLAGVRADPRAGRVLSDEGSFTVTPTFSPDGSKVALLSNRGSDYSATSLYLIDTAGGELKHLAHGSSSRPAFSPDGGTIYYGKHVKQNLYGSKRSDLFAYDIDEEEETRLTENARAAEIGVSADGGSLVYVVNGDGTHTLAVSDADGKNQRILLEGAPGTQFYGPQFSPDGGRVLFGVFEAGTRDIATIGIDGTDMRYLLRTPNDERDARWVDGGAGILFASDRTGIFNAYTMDVGTGDVVQRTNVEGGVFEPDMAPDGAIVYSGYDGDGYHVAVLDAGAAPVAEMPAGEYARRATGEFEECAKLKLAGGAGTASSLTSGGAAMAGSAQGSASALDADAVPYKRSYTDFQLYPRAVIYDGDFRFGAFAGSNEILEKQNMFAGGSVGTNGEYDGFILLEFRHLLPVLYMQFFTVREKFTDFVPVEDIEYKLDIRYDLWSADLGVRFEFEDPYSLFLRNDIAFWYSHSEYKVFIDPFFRNADEPDSPFLPDFPVGWKYYIGNDFYLQWNFKAIAPATDGDINPRGGRQFSLTYMRAEDELFQDDNDFEYGFKPEFTVNSFNQYTLDWREYIGLPWWRHALQLRLKGSVIDTKVNDFFHIYMGGLDGIRGYTYYSIGGRRGALGSATYRFPIWRHINKQLLHLSFNDIYGGVFFESANAWNETELKTNDWKKSVGYEVRLNMRSFYAYPLAINFTSAYSLNEVEFFNPIYTDEVIVNEKSWRHYVTVGFAF